ncbi:serine/threonine-protein kinase [Okeania sp.]|uniref:serine/threonine-protein kinase n=1 Tax=Okeania sp. TaxID=3100323 RepID=UPI002B4B7C92|nr:serine/threonine-protein kinase [Okeania sp.]MEB3339541.1 serine/threonine-protein kinase [Okeania sp.]
MSYCTNPNCPQPQNPDSIKKCQTCGSQLILRDRYEIVQPLGKGGFGATFLAKDISLPGDPICVIKELRPSTTTASVLEMARKLFEREAETLGKIGHHPQIPSLLGYFEWKKHFHLVQEYVSGSTLKQEVKKQGLFTEEKARKFLIDILPLIDYIHTQGVIHRDIKPANIIRRSQGGNLVLIDFGAVKDHVSQTHISTGTGETAFTNISIGTSGFAPPEQMALRPVYASDIYALGVTTIYLLTGKSPKSLGYNRTNGEILWRPVVNVSDKFGEILEKMLEVSVKHRFQSAPELLAALNTKTTKKKQVKPQSDETVNTVFTDNNNTVFTDNNNTVFNDNNNTVFNDNNNDVSLISPGTKIAQKIRERKNRLNKAPRPPVPPKSLKMKEDVTEGYFTTVSPKKKATNAALSSLSSKNKTSNTTELGGAIPTKWTAASLRSAYIRGRRDFADCDLSNFNLRNAKLSGANFYGANFHEANLEGADLSEANFGHANLTDTILKNANLTKAYLSTASLAGSNLQDADMTGAYMNGANLHGANLSGANLSNAMVSNSQLETAKTNWWTTLPNGKRGSGF